MTRLISFFGTRMEETLRRWPRTTRNEVRRYLDLPRAKVKTVGRLSPRMNDQPYWLLLPLWLKERFAGNRSRDAGGRFIADILWAQYCLFLFIRIQDDLFDRHTERRGLIYAADGFLLEAERIFSRYFGSSLQFWDIYRGCIGETILAVAAADALQARSARSDGRLLSCYGRTAAICTVAALAVCLRNGQIRRFSRIRAFSGEMMMAGAIVDDLLDMDEDLRRGRINYAASRLLPRRGRNGSRKLPGTGNLSRNPSAKRELPGVFREIRSHLGSAEAALSPMAVPAAREYLESYRRSLGKMELLMKLQRAI